MAHRPVTAAIAAKDFARRLIMSMSGGATLAATGQWLTMQPKGQRVLGFHYDTGERRRSIEGLFAAS